MKLSLITLTLTAVLSTTAAQGLLSLPNCAKYCATASLPPQCGIDVACICKDQSFLNNIACCVANRCNQKQQQETLVAAKQICARGGVHNLPNTVQCKKGSTGGSTGAGAGAGSSSASQTTLSGTVTESSSMMSSAAPTSMGSSTTGSSGSTTTSASGTGSGSGSGSSASSASSSASSAAATSTGAAVLGQNKDSSLMAAAGAAAAFAILI